MSVIWDHQLDLMKQKYSFKNEVRGIESYVKYLDAVVDNGYRHNFSGSVSEWGLSTLAYTELLEITVNKSPAFVLPLTKPLVDLGGWLSDGNRAPIPPCVVLPKTNIVFNSMAISVTVLPPLIRHLMS